MSLLKKFLKLLTPDLEFISRNPHIISIIIILTGLVILFIIIQPRFDKGRKIAFSPTYGGKGGHTNFQFTCPINSYITEIGGHADHQAINTIAVGCSDGTKSNVYGINPATTKKVTSHSGSAWVNSCPTGFQTISGFTVDKGNVTDISGLVTYCNGKASQDAGTRNGDFWRYTCPGGNIVGIEGKYDEVAVNKLQFKCATK